MPRRRQSHRLERVLGAPALFATAYGNVGSSIYYALGLTAGIALGLTPIVFIISGLIFAATAATYAETGEADGYRFILGKSALETGRVEEGKAGLAQLLAAPALSLEASKTGCVVSREDLERDLQRR